MSHFYGPVPFNREVACIAEDPALAASLLSVFSEKNRYLAIVAAPRMKRPDWHNEVIRSSNAIARTRPNTVILAGVSGEGEEALRVKLGNTVGVVNIRSLDDIEAFYGRQRRERTKGEIRCASRDIALGLLFAMRHRRFLLVDDSSPPFAPTSSDEPRGHIVVLDDIDGIAQVIAAGYAYAIQADLAVIFQPNASLNERIRQTLNDRLAPCDQPERSSAVDVMADLTHEVRRELRFGQRRFATFITREIPYGYFYPETPSTHIFSNYLLGYMIIASIYSAAEEPHCISAVVVDPGLLDHSERPAILSKLAEGGVCVEDVSGGRATAQFIKLFVEAYPYDLLFFCSHCEEMSGERWSIRVPDSQGGIHLVVVDIAMMFTRLGFSQGLAKEIEVTRHFTPVSINGVPWHDADEGTKRHFGDIWQYLRYKDERQWDVVSKEAVSRVPFTPAIRLKSGAVVLTEIQTIDSQVAPVVINNSCNSFYDAAGSLIFAGARSYVGTLASIDSEDAQRLAEILFEDETRAYCLPLALWMAQRKVFGNPEDRTYVHVGCHFTFLRFPGERRDSVVQHRIENALHLWRQHVPPQGAYTGRLEDTIKFLSVLLARR